jgi:hypothetical protein
MDVAFAPNLIYGLNVYVRAADLQILISTRKIRLAYQIYSGFSIRGENCRRCLRIKLGPQWRRVLPDRSWNKQHRQAGPT